MVLFFSSSRTQSHIYHDEEELRITRGQSSGPTFRIPWFMTPISFLVSCFQKVTTVIIAYFLFPFLLDDLETEVPVVAESTEVNSSKVSTAGPDITLILLFSIIWLRRKPQDYKQEEERKRVSTAVLQLLYTWNISLCRPWPHMFPCPHSHTGYKCCNLRLPALPWSEGPHCEGCFQTTKYDPHFHSPCLPYKEEKSLLYNALLYPGEIFPTSLSVYYSEKENIKIVCKNTADKIELRTKEDQSLPEPEGDVMNLDVACLFEDYFPLPTDEEEVERWDDLDEHGAEFERSIDLKMATAKSVRYIGKAKKALKLIQPGAIKKMETEVSSRPVVP